MRALLGLALLAAVGLAGTAAAPDGHGKAAKAVDPDTGHPLSFLGPGDDPLVAQALGVGAVAGVAGALAYYWPRLQFLGAALFTRIPRDEALNQVNREKVYNLIRARPGIHAHAIATELRLGWSTAFYHLRTLESHGLVASRRVGRYRCFFAVGDPHAASHEAVALLRHATARGIAELVAAKPGIVQKDLCEQLGISSSLASWHLQRLAAAGVVHAERAGRYTRYTPGAAWTRLQDLAEDLRGPPRPPAARPSAALEVD